MADATRSEIIRAFIPESPFVGVLGLRLERLEPDVAVLVLPFRPELATIGEVVHGGAISTLIDTAAMAAAWARDRHLSAGVAGWSAGGRPPPARRKLRRGRGTGAGG